MALSCGDGETSVDSVSPSGFFVYHDRKYEPLCPTLLTRLDEHLTVIGQKIGLEPDAKHPLHYVRYRDLADFEENSGCDIPAGLNGCSSEGVTLSTDSFHAHELVHSYVYRAWGRHSTGLLTEGVAAALSCEPFYPLQPSQTAREVLLNHLDALQWEDLLHIRGDSNAGYGAASFFVTYLADQFGWSKLSELYRRVPPNVGAGAFERAFESVYPISLTQAWSEALNTPGASACQTDWPCRASSLEVGSSAAADCDGQFHRRLEIAEPGGVVVSLAGRDRYLRLMDCTAAAPAVFELVGGQTTASITHFASMPQGSYTMFRGNGRPPDRVEFLATLAPSWIAADCGRAGSVTLDPSEETTLAFPAGNIPSSGASNDGTAWIRLAGADHGYDVSAVGLLWLGLHPEAALELCDRCEASASCTPIPPGGSLTTTIGNDAALMLRHVMSLPAASDAWAKVQFYPTVSAPSR